MAWPPRIGDGARLFESLHPGIVKDVNASHDCFSFGLDVSADFDSPA
jgi:hypothetical protein